MILIGPTSVVNVPFACATILSIFAWLVACATSVLKSEFMSRSKTGESVLIPTLPLLTSKKRIGVESNVVFLKERSTPFLFKLAFKRCPPIRPIVPRSTP